MTDSQLCELRPGDSLILSCGTSEAHIFFKKKNDPLGRVPYLPTAGQIIPFTYEIEGRFVELEYTDDQTPAIRYVVLSTFGLGADLRSVNGQLKLVGSRLRQKFLHIPRTAIANCIKR
ncbi:hypothetical protein [Spirosoma sp. KNUC1025]|uniref:hypothetical protein n=1 Tax=Spirosoma sp. KNUC1025 TaxID=2894082 RepID=UPI0038692F57|nr:hypothetical protein LN737_19270 [Spirosoma sp. KNUC1025]